MSFADLQSLVSRQTEDLLQIITVSSMVENGPHCVLQGRPDVARAELNILFVDGKMEQPSDAVARYRYSFSCVCSLEPVVDRPPIAISVGDVNTLVE